MGVGVQLRMIAVLVVVVLALAGCGGSQGDAQTSERGQRADPPASQDGSTTDESATQDSPSDDGTGDGQESDDPESDDPESTAEAEEVSVFDLEVGTCWDDPADLGEVEEVAAIDCDELHDNEVIALVDLPEDSDAEYPGEDELQERAAELCLDEFEDYVGVPYDDSPLLIFPLTPSEDTWKIGDREVVCSVYDEEPLQGSARAGSQVT